MLSKITDKIWLGNELDSFAAMGCTAILTVAVEPFPSDILATTAKCGLIDGPGNPPALYQAALCELHGLLAMGHTVMVHCIEGVSRSPFIVACYLAMLTPEPENEFENCLEQVKAAHPPTNVRPEHLAIQPDLDLFELYRTMRRAAMHVKRAR
jgi:hypothetical protein